jgi:hypothetical protein
MPVLMLQQSGGDSAAARAGGVGAPAAATDRAESETDPAEEDARDDAHQGAHRKKKRRKGIEDEETGLAKILKANAHRINEEFIPSAFAMLESDMHEGGAAKRARDKLFFRIVAALDIGGVRERGKFEEDASEIPGRLKLVATGLQTVDQVSWHIALEILTCSNVMTIRPFCSKHGR